MSAVVQVRLTFGDALRACREERGLSYKEVGDQAGVSKSLVKQWERNEATPETVRLKRLIGMMRRLAYYTGLLHTAELRDTGEPSHLQLSTPPTAREAPATFAEALRRARVAEGLSQDELGELLRVDGSAVCSWERAVNCPIVDHYQKLVELLPALADAPQPDRLVDMEKPGREPGGDYPPAAPPADRAPPRTFEPRLVDRHPAEVIQAAGYSAEPNHVTAAEAGRLYAAALLAEARAKAAGDEIARQLAEARVKYEEAVTAAKDAERELRAAVMREAGE